MNDSQNTEQINRLRAKIADSWSEIGYESHREVRHYVGVLVSGLVARQGLPATARDLVEIDQQEHHLVRSSFGPDWMRHALEDARIGTLEAQLAINDAKDGMG